MTESRHRRAADRGTADAVPAPDAPGLARSVEELPEVGHDVLLTLQRSLLPAGLPVLAGFRIAAHYLVAGTEQAAGGDWYDAIPLAGGLAVVVGDVVGHGVEAAAAMGQLRALLEEFLLDSDDLAAVLARLDRFAMRVAGARGTTVCLALLDPVTGSVRYACAGHPPPLVLAADGTTRFLPLPGGGPLGVAGPLPVVASTRLGPGDLLLCFSDGLVEREGRDLGSALDGLAEVASTALTVGAPSLHTAEPADRVAELTVERMTRDGYGDDVTLVAVRLTGQPHAEFVADLPAEPERLPALRRRLEAWLVGTGAGEPDVVAVQIAVLEAVTNAIEHAYDEPGGWVRVEGLLDGVGRACMTVIDHGRWRPASADPGNRGRGLMMMRGCMDTVEIETSEQGTTLLLDRHLHRAPVVSGARPVPVRTGPEVGLSVKVELSVEPRLTVFGPVDAGTVDELRRQLRSASRGGALPLTVELRYVTHLASAGVQLLFDFVEEMTADGRTLALVAPPTCPAWQVISMTGLDRVVTVTEV